MTVGLVYDSVLSRVRITADGLAAADHATIERSTDQILWTTVRGGVTAPIVLSATVKDTFTRTGSNGWGTPDLGGPYIHDAGVAADYATDGSTGSMLADVASVLRRAITGPFSVDGRIEGTLVPGVVATGNSFEQGLILRRVDIGNNYAAEVRFLTGGTLNLRFVRTLATTAVSVANVNLPGSYTSTTKMRLIFEISGATLLAKAWDLSGSEPSGWQLTHTDTNITAAGQVGAVLRVQASNTNVPLTVRFDDIVAGPAQALVDDYEFVAGKQNFYRIRAVETGPITFVAAGTAASGNNVSLVPALPGGIVSGDLLVVLVSIRNSGTGTVNTPAGWTVLRNFTSDNNTKVNAVLLGRTYQAGDTAPTVTFTDGVLGADTIAQMAAFRRAELTPVTSAGKNLNASAQNIAFPALTIPEDKLLVLVAGWKQDDWTSVAALTGFTEIGETTSITGDDAGQVWDFQVQTGKTNIAAGSFSVSGGLSAISRGAVVAFEHAEFLNEQTANITPVLDRIWLKSVTRPFLNRPVTVVDWSDVQRPSRGSDFDVVGRTLPIAVTDVTGGKRFDIDVYTAVPDDAQTLDFIVASGDVLFLHTPQDCEVPGGHMRVDTSSERRPRPRASSRVFTLPLRQVAAPGPDVVGVTSTWTTVLDSYPSWEALLAANATWAELLARIAPPSEVVVP